MKEWHLVGLENQPSLLIDNITLFKGNFETWVDIIDTLQKHFSHKTTSIKIIEDETLLPKNDFEFHVISNYEGLTSESLDSLLLKTKSDFLSYLEISPFYKQLVDSWDELISEVDFLSSQNPINLINYELKAFNKKLLSDALIVSASKLESLTAYEKLLLQINLLRQNYGTKQLVVCIISPEQFLSELELGQLNTYLHEYNNGILYFLVSNYHFDNNLNIIYKNKVRNMLDCISISEILRNRFPFAWSDQLFKESCTWYLNLVDKYQAETVILDIDTVDNFQLFICIYSIFVLSDTPIIVDLSAIPIGYIGYIDSLLTDTV